MAASGKYRSPVLLDGFPDLVRHFWSPQSFSDFCGAFNLYTLHRLLCTSLQQVALYVLTTDLHLCHELLRLSPATQSSCEDRALCNCQQH
jgi:hypothetical protein